MKDLIRKILKEESKRKLNESNTIQPSDFCTPIDRAIEPSGRSTYHFGHDREDHLHAGVDLKSNSGDLLRAPYGGEVEYAGIVSKCGGMLVIHHGGGLRTKYCHIKTFSVEVGQTVVKGEQVGTTGGDSSDVGKGNSSSAHLHYSIHPNTTTYRGLKYENGTDPENGWLGNSDCNEPSSDDIIVIDDKEQTDKNKTNKYHDGYQPDCYGVLSTNEVKMDTLKIIKIYENGFIIDDDDIVVNELKFTPNSIENMDKNNVNAKGIELYAYTNGLKDGGNDISIDNGNIWVNCRLNSVVFNHINDNDITY